jgi:hypothetical protein
VKRRWYLVTATRSTEYRVRATSKDEAIDTITDADEVDGTTHNITAEVDPDQSRDVKTRGLDASEILHNNLVSALTGNEWNADTCDQIANILRSAGYTINDVP